MALFSSSLKKLLPFFLLPCSFLFSDDSYFEKKITYSFTTDPIDVVIPSCAKDKETLDLCIEGIKKNGKNIRRIIVVSKEPLTDKAEWFDETKYPFSKSDVAVAIFHGDKTAADVFLHHPQTRVGWIYQQLLKFYAPFVIPNISENVLMLDSDTVFLAPIEFMNEKGEPLFNVGDEHHPPYFAHAARLLPGLSKKHENYSGITNQMLFQKCILRDLFRAISLHHQKEPWKALCSCIDLEEVYNSCLSEYEIYFNFALLRSDQIHIRPLKWTNAWGTFTLSDYQKEGCAYISCHDYSRETWKNLYHSEMLKEDMEKLASTKTAESIPYSIAFVHLGPTLPPYLKDSIAQARLFNKCASLYLIANEEALRQPPVDLTQHKVNLIAVESLKKSAAHERFLQKLQINNQWKEGYWTWKDCFWRKTLERFFYLDDFVENYKIGPLFHLENDVMLYANLSELLPQFQKNYLDRIAATFDNDERCIAGFMYIPNRKPLEQLAVFIADRAQEEGGGNDMVFLNQFNHAYNKIHIDSLPILPSSYSKDHALQSVSGLKSVRPEVYSNHSDDFHCLFDAAALGQYLGGIDPQHTTPKPGFINESALINPNDFSYCLEKDSEGRAIPTLFYKKEKWRITNLHIHSKNLNAFSQNQLFN